MGEPGSMSRGKPRSPSKTLSSIHRFPLGNPIPPGHSSAQKAVAQPNHKNEKMEWDWPTAKPRTNAPPAPAADRKREAAQPRRGKRLQPSLLKESKNMAGMFPLEDAINTRKSSALFCASFRLKVSTCCTRTFNFGQRVYGLTVVNHRLALPKSSAARMIEAIVYFPTKRLMSTSNFKCPIGAAGRIQPVQALGST